MEESGSRERSEERVEMDMEVERERLVEMAG